MVYSNTIQSLAAVIKGMDLLGINFANATRRVSLLQFISLVFRVMVYAMGHFTHTELESNTPRISWRLEYAIFLQP